VTASPARALWLAAAAGVAAMLAVVLGIVLLGAELEAGECGEAGGGPAYAPSAEALAGIPGNYLVLYQRAAAAYGLGGEGWSWLAAVGSIETDHGRLRAPGVTSGENRAGAGGPMQFLSATWAAYGVDGNGDGVVSRYDARDAIPGAARYLQASGAPGDWPRALFAYNHAGWYGVDVARRAAAYRGAAKANSNAPPASGRRVADAGTPSLPTQPPGPIAQTRADHRARPLGSWQTDDAVDLAVPAGSDVLAVDDGEIVKVSADSVTLRTRSNRFFYAGLRRVGVHDGERVSAGQVIGASGLVNRAEQLHIAVEHGDPTALWGNGAADAQSAPLGGCDAGVTGPASLGQAQAVRAPRAFAMLPAWAMAGRRAPAEIDARIVPDVLWILRTYALRVTAGREVGHLSHGDGTALDLVPADPGAGQAAWDASALRLAHDIGWTQGCAASGTAPACPLKGWVRFVGYNGYPHHGDPAHVGANAHLHVSWLASAQPQGALAPANAWVRVFPVPAAAQDGT
jgi:hypothetical protein